VHDYDADEMTELLLLRKAVTRARAQQITKIVMHDTRVVMDHLELVYEAIHMHAPYLDEFQLHHLSFELHVDFPRLNTLCVYDARVDRCVCVCRGGGIEMYVLEI